MKIGRPGENQPPPIDPTKQQTDAQKAGDAKSAVGEPSSMDQLLEPAKTEGLSKAQISKAAEQREQVMTSRVAKLLHPSQRGGVAFGPAQAKILSHSVRAARGDEGARAELSKMLQPGSERAGEPGDEGVSRPSRSARVWANVGASLFGRAEGLQPPGAEQVPVDPDQGDPRGAQLRPPSSSMGEQLRPVVDLLKAGNLSGALRAFGNLGSEAGQGGMDRAVQHVLHEAFVAGNPEVQGLVEKLADPSVSAAKLSEALGPHQQRLTQMADMAGMLSQAPSLREGIQGDRMTAEESPPPNMREGIQSDRMTAEESPPPNLRGGIRGDRMTAEESPPPNLRGGIQSDRMTAEESPPPDGPEGPAQR